MCSAIKLQINICIYLLKVLMYINKIMELNQLEALVTDIYTELLNNTEGEVANYTPIGKSKSRHIWNIYMHC